MVVEVISNDGLTAFIHVNVAHRLLPRLVQLRQGLDRCPTIALCLKRQAPVAFSGVDIFAHVAGRAPGELREHAV